MRGLTKSIAFNQEIPIQSFPKESRLSQLEFSDKFSKLKQIDLIILSLTKPMQ